ncbi:MAG TPA: cytochrome c oxidase assembly factor Coa1 family protein [Terracidiphilus sp.]|nr:cytochrome c oxidase assembly factor Coa1 family protein [Terracidiphilus sp.]
MKNFLKRRRFMAVLAITAALVIVMGAGWFFWFERQAQAPLRLAASAARGSDEVRAAIGSPMRVGEFARGSLTSSGGSGTVDLTVRIEGPKGRGNLFEWAQETEGRWHVCSLEFQLQGGATRLMLVDEATTHCERE